MFDKIKRAAIDAVEATNPVNIIYGTVIKINPLEIKVHEKLVLSEEFLVLTERVKDHDVEMTVDHMTEKRSGGGGESAYESHDHQYKGRKIFRVHNNLIIGDQVVMARIQGGHKFLVIDRVKEREF